MICLDPDGQLERQYRDFITFRDFRFRNADIARYLDHNFGEREDAVGGIAAPEYCETEKADHVSKGCRAVAFTRLEDRHEASMARTAS